MDNFKKAVADSDEVARILAELISQGASDAILQASIDEFNESQLYLNETYQVSVRQFDSPIGLGEMLHFSIKRRDREPIRDWRDMQEIKNQLAGVEREACELYPAESRLVDMSNQYHLWVLPIGYCFPFGFETRMVSGEPNDLPYTLSKAKQRPRKNGG